MTTESTCPYCLVNGKALEAELVEHESRGNRWMVGCQIAREQVAALNEALENVTDVMGRLGPPKISQGGLCEEEDWQAAMRKARSALEVAKKARG